MPPDRRAPQLRGLAEGRETGFVEVMREQAEAALHLPFSADSAASRAIIDEYPPENALARAKISNTTTKDQLRDTLREGIAAGEGVPDLRNRVKSVFAEVSTNRADTNARAETARAFEYADERAMIGGQASSLGDGPQWARP